MSGARKIGSRSGSHAEPLLRTQSQNFNSPLSALHHTYDPNGAGRSFYRRDVFAVRSSCTDGFMMRGLINCMAGVANGTRLKYLCNSLRRKRSGH